VKVTRLKIENFRSIKDLDFPLSSTTVLIGQNNAGKTAILEALRIALTRRWGQRGTGFTEYDIRLETDESDPKLAPPVKIEIELSEQAAGEWPQEIHDELADVVQVDPTSGNATIILRVTCSWDTVSESYSPKWEFLGSTRAPLTGKGARIVNMSRFFEFIPTFYLDALRDASDEFSARSQFWGKLLRSINIPGPLSRRAEKIFDALNRKFLAADPKVGRVSNVLKGVGDIATDDEPGDVSIRVVPFKTWDLISKSQVILKNSSSHPWLPIGQHGRGVQSLSVIFVFHAFVAELLKELYRPGSQAFLELEEPETHLHPQAARSLWRHVKDLPGQKLVTTHSPYFVQHVPFRDLRLIRVGKAGTTFSSLPERFATQIPIVPPLLAFIATRTESLSYDAGSGRFAVRGRLEETDYRQLLTIYAGHAEAPAVISRLKSLKAASEKYVSDNVLDDLQEWAKRIRGEIFFARRWLLVEGQCEYLLAHAIGEAVGYSLDANGVAVIDCQNNGSAKAFAQLARGLDIPWCAVFDNDQQGRASLNAISACGFSQEEVQARCKLHANGDLEQQILAGLGEALVRQIAEEIGIANLSALSVIEVIAAIQKKRKVAFAVALVNRIRMDVTIVDKMPHELVASIRAMRGLQ
jgi:putative ATP-dependent endonuclease of OLD family